ncbi:ThiF family adenylyltransferase [Candidatus Woesearchaeota archaeon]|nr:ThiF family adenylyltransferase [Candidatus Woesearchaeota archaeon]
MHKYSNNDAVAELGDEPADIRKKTVTVLGLGALGTAVAELLARMGINLRIIDKDRVNPEDLDKLSLFSEAYASKFKAKEAKKLLEGINKDAKIKAFHEELMKNNAYLVESDAVIDCSNDLDTTLLADAARKKTPLIYTRAAGVEGCLLVIDDLKVKNITSFLEKCTPTTGDGAVVNTTISLVAALAVNKALKILTGQRHEKNLLLINGWKFSIDKIPVRKDKKQ